MTPDQQQQDRLINAIVSALLVLILGFILIQGCAAIMDPDHSAKQRHNQGGYTQPAEGP